MSMPAAFHLLAKPVGPLCNLDCRYCFYLEKERLYPSRRSLDDWTMPPAVLEAFVRQYIESHPGPVVTFSWQGGEPTLLGIEFFERALALQRRHADGKQSRTRCRPTASSWTTPGAGSCGSRSSSSGSPSMARAGSTIGTGVDRGGAPTFDAVMRGLSVLARHGVEFNTLTVVTPP